jgi:Ca2+-binding RTX toxin-like protein
MATLLAGTVSGTDLSAFDLAALTPGAPTQATPTTYRFPNIEFQGLADFAYDAGQNLVGGTIANIIVFSGASEVFRITGMALAVTPEIAGFLASNDSQGLLGAIFAELDTLNGSAFADHLIGYADRDRLLGNNGSDTLEGAAGDDTLLGGAGVDSMDGGDGADTYDVDDKNDVTKDSGVAGRDLVISTVTLTLDDSIEDLTLGGTAAINGTGNASDNELTGNGAANVLDGKAGADTMHGKNGNDTYIVDDKGDFVDEKDSTGTDSVLSSASEFTLGVNVNNLTLTGVGDINGTGNELGNTIAGNAGDNFLDGKAGNDAIAGGPGGNDTLDGGIGNDLMAGGTGNDVYFVDNSGDVVSELDNDKDGGTDTVHASVSFELDSDLENLVLLNAPGGGVLNLTGIGNTGKNHITGNDGDNLLAGDDQYAPVAAGNDDTLVGGKGDDTYLVWYAGDKVIEEETGEAGGYDIVKSVATFTLGDNVEELILTSTIAVDGTGNELDNKITGNKKGNELSGLAGNDSLNGGIDIGNDTLDGGTGDDTMVGAAGDDLYVVDSVKDVVTDSSGTNDGIRLTSANVELVRLYTGIEHYDFSQFGAGPIDFTGTTGANRIVGTAGNDTLTGGNGNDTLDGGPGNDSLIGGAGNDTYVIDVLTDKFSETGKDTGDTVQTATAGLHIDLRDPIFTNIENVTFTDVDDKTSHPLDATGTDAAKNILTGNSADNFLAGLAGNDTLIGNGGKDTLSGGAGSDSMAGGSGDDQYLVDTTGDKILETSNAGEVDGDLVTSTISYVLGVNLERLVLLGGNLNLNGKGNDLENVIVGNDGNNLIDGWKGKDTMSGGKGDDTYVVLDDTDVAKEAVGGGKDLIEAWVDWTLAADEEIENLTLKGIADYEATGNKLANVITGNKGGNKIDGLAGDDTMIGLAGDDIYTMDSLADKVVEASGGGGDEIIFDLDSKDPSLFLVRANIEHYNFSKYEGDAVNFTGDGAGNRITGTGKSGDVLFGGAGNDTLDGFFGADSLTGGAGNDSYVLDNVGDVFTEIVNGKDAGGKDTIVSMFAAYTLDEPDPSYNIENLTIGGFDGNSGTGNSAANVLTGNGGKNALSGVAGNDTIIGNDGADTLDGGTGNDSMVGGDGSDWYILDSKSDRILETFDTSPATNDTIVANFSYVLRQYFENLVLTGTANINGTGTAVANELTGNDGNNKLDGVVNKVGGDQLSGGKGDDTYYVHVAKTALTGIVSDIVNEEAGEGTDTVITDARTKLYTLTDDVENLTLTGSLASKGGGNGLDNVLIGNSGANTLQGEGGDDSLSGGAGNDTLLGGSGDDTLSGGAGADVLNGDLGSDTYVVDNAKDLIQDKGLGSEIDTIQASISIDLNLVGFADAEGVQLTGSGALSATGDGGNNRLVGNTGGNKLFGNGGDDTILGGGGNDTIDGGLGDDTFLYTSKLDGKDVINGFEGGTTGQDVLDLDALFDSLNVATVDRAVVLNDKGSSVEVRVDVDGKDTNGAEFLVATLNTADDITVGAGADILIGTL